MFPTTYFKKKVLIWRIVKIEVVFVMRLVSMLAKQIPK